MNPPAGRRALMAAILIGSLVLEAIGGEVLPQIACSTYNFRKVSVFEAVEKAAECGVFRVETFTNQPLSPEDSTRIYDCSEAQLELLRKHLRKHKVEIASCMLAMPKDEARARVVFEIVRKLGAKNIGTDSVGSIDTVEKLVKEFGITVAFHNHPNNPARPEYRNSDPYFMRELLKGRDARIGVCADTGHWASSGVVPLDAIKLLEGRIHSVHLKERAAIGSRTPDMVFGSGVTQSAEIIAELRRQKFTGLIVIEYETNPLNNMGDIRQCVDFLNRHLGVDAAKSNKLD